MTHDEIIEALQDYKLPSPLVHEISASIFRLYDNIERAQDRINRLFVLHTDELQSLRAENTALRAALDLYAAIENWQETAVTEQLTGNVNSDGDEEEVEVELYLGEPLVWGYQGLAGPHLAQVALGMRNANDYWTSYEVSGRITR
jgi:hypothetical protein